MALPEHEYRAWAGGKITDPAFVLGAVQLVPVTGDIAVANLIGQSGCGYRNGVPPIRYEAIAAGLTRLIEVARTQSASVHMPKMGAGLAGGDWGIIEGIVARTLSEANIPVFVYTF